jgi:hypothetical protein
MKSSWLRVALKENVSESDFDQTAWKYGWLWSEDVLPTAENPYEIIRTTRNNQTSIHYFDDHLINARYIIVDGVEEEAHDVYKKICSELDVYKYEDVECLVNNAINAESFIDAIYRVAIAAPSTYEPRYFQLFEKVLAFSDSKVRDAAILAIGYVGWPEFREILEKIKKTDTHPTVRESATVMLDGYKRFNINSENLIQSFSGIYNSKETKIKNHKIIKENHRTNTEKVNHSVLKDYSKLNIIFKDASIKQKFIEFALDSGWQLKGTREVDVENYLPFEIAWVTPDQQTAIHYIEDWYLEDGAIYPFSLKTPYLIIEGGNLKKTALQVSSFFDTYTDEEIIQWVETASNSEDLISAVVHLAYAAPEQFDTRYFSCLLRVLSNSDTWVRLAAVWAVGCIGWREFQDVLENMSNTDLSSDVKLQASHMLEVFDTPGESQLLNVLDFQHQSVA